MRGKHVAEHTIHIGRGNIPAYAGKTPQRQKNSAGSTEHPRVCGENIWAAEDGFGDAGTSPRMRGKPCSRALNTRLLRNIPAYAGKTIFSHSAKRSQQEHPRVCGENKSVYQSRSVGGGTSPRMRGKLFQALSKSDSPRNIPAYAGKTRVNLLEGQPQPEHPRVCGENDLTI